MQIQELADLFKWQKIDAMEYYVLQAESKEVGEEYLGILKENISQYKLDNQLVWDPQNLTISLPIDHFIEWQRSDISARLKNKRKINLEHRVFFKRDDGYFTIAINKESIKSLQATLMRCCKDFETKPIINTQYQIIEMSSKDYEKFRNYLGKKSKVHTAFNTREIYKDDESQCYYWLPKENESLSDLKKVVKRYLSKLFNGTDVLVDFVANEKNQRLEISKELYDHINSTVATKVKKKKSTSTAKRQYHEKADYYCTFPENDNEKPSDILFQLKSHFHRYYQELNIKVFIDDINQCVCIAKEDYLRWKSICSDGNANWIKVANREFKFNKKSNFWEFVTDKEKELKNLYWSAKRVCKKFNLDSNIFILDGNKIRIANEDYKKFNHLFLLREALKNNAFGKTLKRDESRRVFYFESEKPYQSVRSFNKLAKTLDIKVKFYSHNCRVELSEEDYKVWMANPIIQSSFEDQKEITPHEATFKKVIAPRVSLKQGDPQKAENTKGGISAKYLEGMYNVPFKGTECETKDSDPDLLKKGHVIPFVSFKNLLESNNHPRAHKTSVKINHDGIKGNVIIYQSKNDNLREILSNKKIVFVRGGRKEEALIPKIAQNENVEVMFLITQQEFNEIEKSLAFNPALRIPHNVKLCVIESCSLTSQPAEEPDSYVRASNIKRVIAFALAHCFDIHQFILMDDNTTQIQMAEKVVKDASVTSLFRLFRQYKDKGAVCAMLGSFEFYKPITRPLEAVEPEDIKERLGSKIMYVDYKRIHTKLKKASKHLHELFSPCSLWWGEDYFNMLAIMHLMETEEQAGLLGVLPYSVAWHRRSHVNQNKAKQTPHFKLANIWLDIDENYLKSLSPHHQNVVRLLKNIVKKAIEDQSEKMNKYLQSLDKAVEVTQEPHYNMLESELSENVIFDKGFILGQHTAKIGVPCNIAKLKKKIHDSFKFNQKETQDYIDGFMKGHLQKWASMSPEQKAFCRGYRDGKIAAKQSYTADSIKISKIPKCYLEQSSSYEQGFTKGNNIQWQRLRKPDNIQEVELAAKFAGSDYALKHFDIHESKLHKMSALYGANQQHFATHFKEAFHAKRLTMSAQEMNDLLISRAKNVAKELSQSHITQLNMAKLDSASARLGNSYCRLYQETVVSEFNRLKEVHTVGVEAKLQM